MGATLAVTDHKPFPEPPLQPTQVQHTFWDLAPNAVVMLMDPGAHPPPLTSPVTNGRVLNLSVPPFPHL